MDLAGAHVFVLFSENRPRRSLPFPRAALYGREVDLSSSRPRNPVRSVGCKRHLVRLLVAVAEFAADFATLVVDAV
jgi:hypothetical protein